MANAQQKSQPPILILACDGGGIRGALSAALLEHMADVSGLARMYAGTSTGSILASALALGFEPSVIASLYREHGPSVFAHRDRIDRWSSLDELRRANYSHVGLASALSQTLGARRPRFAAHTRSGFLRDDPQPHILVVSYDLDRNRPKVWSSTKPQDANWELARAILCSCSAPIYLPSYEGKTGNRHVDGGVVANSPGMCAVAEMLHEGADLDRLWVLSIGTGISGSPVRLPEKPEPHDDGLLGWAPDIVDLVLGGSELLVDYQLRQLLGDRYCRVDVPLSRPVKLDDARPEMIHSLEVDASRGFAPGTSARDAYEDWRSAFMAAQLDDSTPTY